jgi:hypothetical protein
MKRIVKSVFDWKQVDNHVWAASPTDALKLKIKSFDKSEIICTEADGYEVYFCVDGTAKFPNTPPLIGIEQITFDQAFKDLSEQGKPIIKVLPNHSVWWVYRYSKLEMLELFIFIFESGYINSTVITWDKFINSACEDAQYYQSDSHLDFLLHDLPTLIRMAREGV